MTEKLGKYELHEELGRGGFASVYRATHATLGTEVAVKVLNTGLAGDEQARQRFTQEAQTASALEHPGIVRVLDLDNSGEQPFLAMEYMPGGDLKTWQEAHGAFTQQEILSLLAQVATALDYAHSQGALHRDVKPNNILLDAQGGAHLSDFGLVRVANAPRLTQIGSVVGSASYVSPEQAEGRELDGRADQYSLAVVAYELLVGQLPFQGETSTAISLMHVTKEPPAPSSLNAEIPREVDDALLKALEKDPTKRYLSCAAFIQDLESALETSQRRQYKELLAEAQTLLETGEYEQVRDLLDQARKVIPDRPEMQDALAELEQARRWAASYEQIARTWETADQKAQDVLELYPDFPDPEGIFVTLGLRKKPFKLPSARALFQQFLFGAAVGLPAAGLVIYLAFRFITR